MSPDDPRAPRDPAPCDAWSVVSYLAAGVLVWGFVGWLVDRWLETRFFVMLGILLGAASAIYLVYVRYGRP